MSQKANLTPQGKSNKNIMWFQVGGEGAAVSVCKGFVAFWQVLYNQKMR